MFKPLIIQPADTSITLSAGNFPFRKQAMPFSQHLEKFLTLNNKEKGSTNNFCRSQLRRKKGPSFEIFQSCCKLHTGQKKYINLYISSISSGRRPVCLLFIEVNCFAVSCSLN